LAGWGPRARRTTVVLLVLGRALGGGDAARSATSPAPGLRHIPLTTPFTRGRSEHADQATILVRVKPGANPRSVGMTGVAWDASVLPVKVLDEDGVGTDASVAAGITWAADHGATVINLSLGGPQPSDVLRQAVDYALARDVVVVAAAGNDGHRTPSYPAAYPGVVAVGARQRHARLVAAPGAAAIREVVSRI